MQGLVSLHRMSKGLGPKVDAATLPSRERHRRQVGHPRNMPPYVGVGHPETLALPGNGRQGGSDDLICTTKKKQRKPRELHFATVEVDANPDHVPWSPRLAVLVALHIPLLDPLSIKAVRVRAVTDPVLISESAPVLCPTELLDPRCTERYLWRHSNDEWVTPGSRFEHDGRAFAPRTSTGRRKRKRWLSPSRNWPCSLSACSSHQSTNQLLFHPPENSPLVLRGDPAFLPILPQHIMTLWSIGSFRYAPPLPRRPSDVEPSFLRATVPYL